MKKTFQPGTKVEFKEIIDEGDNDYPMVVIENRGDRVLIQIDNGMNFKPTQIVPTKDLIEKP
jgi:hypothetical protein